MNIKIVFMGSPEFAVPSLNMLNKHYVIVGVVTQPDRPSGRGRNLVSSPIKILADNLDLTTIQPTKLSEPEAMSQLRAWAPDLIVVAAFGQILRQPVLDLPPYGCINVHGSLLPRWRGAAPIQAAILNGDKKTGITIMKMDPGIDTGPILTKRSIPIQPDDTAETLHNKLSKMGAGLLIETLPPYLNGKLKPIPQDDSEATYAPMLNKSDGKMDFNKTAVELSRQVRAFTPWPGSFMKWQGKTLKVHQAYALKSQHTDPGKTTKYHNLPAVGTGEGLLVLEKVQPAGKRVMMGNVFLHGARDWGQIHLFDNDP